MLTSLHENHVAIKNGMGHKKIKTSYNPKSIYISIFWNLLWTHSGNNGHFKDSCTAKLKAIQKNVKYVEKKKVTWFFIENARLPRWAIKSFIHPFNQRKGPKLIVLQILIQATWFLREKGTRIFTNEILCHHLKLN